MSLRDLAATIVDVLGLEAGSPFPGSSLARCWREPRPTPPSATQTDPALSEVVPGLAINVDAYGLPQKILAAGRPRRRRLVVHPPRGKRPRRIVPPERRRQRTTQPGPRSGRAADSRPDAPDALESSRGGPLMPERFNR